MSLIRGESAEGGGILEELESRVFRVETRFEGRRNAVYLLRGEHGTMLVDAGVAGGHSVVDVLVRERFPGEEIRWVVVTHADPDHFGGLGVLRKFAKNVTVVSHVLDAPLIEDVALYEDKRARQFRRQWGVDESEEVLGRGRALISKSAVEMRVVGGEDIALSGDWVVSLWHVPGHTLGHLAVVDAVRRIVIAGDAVLGAAVPYADGEPAFAPTYRYLKEYLETIGRFEAWGPQWLLTAHWRPMRGQEVRDFLAVSRSFTEVVVRVVMEEVAGVGASGLSLRELMARCGPRLGSWPLRENDVALAYPIVAALEWLLDARKVKLCGDGEGVRRVCPGT